MLSAKELWLNYDRMCDAYPICKDCPACLDNNNSIHDGMLCDDMERVDEFIEVVEKWAKDNPIITNRQKYKEIFGWELLDPVCCRFYHGKSCDHFLNDKIICRNCQWWDEEYKEVRK